MKHSNILEIKKAILKKKNGPSFGYVSQYWSLAHRELLEECFSSEQKRSN